MLGFTPVSVSRRSICSGKKLQTPIERINPCFWHLLMPATPLHIDFALDLANVLNINHNNQDWHGITTLQSS